VWERAVRNLREIVQQGGLVEINSSALRKGLDEPYPTRAICEEYLKLGGKLTLSDDSHGVAQVATNFSRAVNYIESLGVQELWLLEGKNSGERALGLRSVSVESVKTSLA
jgi:histidinol-phosphatase (PHP family)